MEIDQVFAEYWKGRNRSGMVNRVLLKTHTNFDYVWIGMIWYPCLALSSFLSQWIYICAPSRMFYFVHIWTNLLKDSELVCELKDCCFIWYISILFLNVLLCCKGMSLLYKSNTHIVFSISIGLIYTVLCISSLLVSPTTTRPLVRSRCCVLG